MGVNLKITVRIQLCECLIPDRECSWSSKKLSIWMMNKYFNQHVKKSLCCFKAYLTIIRHICITAFNCLAVISEGEVLNFITHQKWITTDTEVTNQTSATFFFYQCFQPHLTVKSYTDLRQAKQGTVRLPRPNASPSLIPLPLVHNLEVPPLQEAAHLGFPGQYGLHQVPGDLLPLLVGQRHVPFL